MPRIVHPVLFSVYPILFLYAKNINEVSMSDIFSPLSISILVTLLVWGIINKIEKNAEESALITSTFLFYFFSYGHVFVYIYKLPNNILDLSNSNIVESSNNFLITWNILFIVLFLGIGKLSRWLNKVNIFANIVSITLVVFSLVTILNHHIKHNAIQNIFSNTTTSNNRLNNNKYPDIFYIIPDSYAGYDTLKNVYGFDNSEFLNYLEEKGFYVAKKSRANYLRTLHSVGSSLNLDYIHNLYPEEPVDSSNESKIYDLIKKPKFVQFLKTYGYKYIISTGEPWIGDLADEYLYPQKNKETDFNTILTRTTILYNNNLKETKTSREKIHWEKVKQHCKLVENRISDLDFVQPKFIFIHLLIPHAPMTFGKNGEFIPPEITESLQNESRYPLYINQLIYTNKILMSLIDKIFSKYKRNMPVIILQSDEGPYPMTTWTKSRTFNWDNASENELTIKTDILNSYYLPNINSKEKVLYQNITPINTFRLISNLYFNTKYELLNDKVYAFSSWFQPFMLSDVTDKIEK